MKDSKGMDSGQYKSKGPKLMKNHGNTSAISAAAQQYDMGRLSKRGHESKGLPAKAFEYKY
tara:strand:+ start:586 stop:768 length:183 start_codon:yes stop_codon:yes gene_type:complete